MALLYLFCLHPFALVGVLTNRNNMFDVDIHQQKKITSVAVGQATNSGEHRAST
ncbi:MAG: hypothetical protein IPL84_04800 [Chitinophagaceae bacterium]|nr:hypothetical protein [Chitinophagaceae bacterium]